MTVNPVSPVVPGFKPRRSDSLLGILLMTGGMFVFSAVDIQAKILAQNLHPVQIVWSRQLGLVLGVVILLALKGPSVLRTQRPFLQVVRGALATGSAVLFIAALIYVPLADAVAVSFVAPFVVTLLGAWVLKEKVGVRRWTAVTIGFIGTLIVIRPGLGAIHPAVMLVFVAAILFAMRQVLSRLLADTDRTATTVAYTALVSGFLLTLPLPFVWQWPQSTTQIGLLVSIAVLAAGAEILVIKALEVAQAVVVAPMQYTLIIWGTAYGYFVFGHWPDYWTWIGTTIIIATGLYTLNRDAKVNRPNRPNQSPEQGT